MPPLNLQNYIRIIANDIQDLLCVSVWRRVWWPCGIYTGGSWGPPRWPCRAWPGPGLTSADCTAPETWGMLSTFTWVI